MKQFASLAAGALALSTMTALPSEATTLSGDLTADNLFTAYLSTNDSVLGTQISSGNNWQVTFSFSGAALTAGVTNYLHIVAVDQGPPAMFIGDFTLSDTGFSFSNGAQHLITDTANWLVSATGFGSNYVTPTDIGASPCCVWGGATNVDAGAHFLWLGNDATLFFSTAITPLQAETPEPASLAILGLGLAGFGVLRRRRRS